VAAESKAMFSVRGGQLLPASPASCRLSTASAWRMSRTTLSSPELSDSKDEEEMDIDPDENSPRADSPTLLLRNRSLTLFSLSDLCISEEYCEPASQRRELTKRSYSCYLPSSEKTAWPSMKSSHSAKQSLPALAYESKIEAEYHLSNVSDVTQLSSPGARRKERLSLAPLDEVNNTGVADSTLKLTTLPQSEQKCSKKSFLFSLAFLMIAAAVFIGSYHSPAAHCVDNIDLKSLHRELKHRVHGQHIAVNIVVRRLEEFTAASGKRSLVMSFHGWTGIGKNFMSSIIAQHLPPTNVHKFIVPLHFARGTENDASLLSDWVISNVSSPSCGLHLFIIDEIDKAHGSLVQSLSESLVELSVRSDVSCRAIFLLLTNDGAGEINTAVAEMLMSGSSREDLKLANLVPNLSSEWYTEMASAKLIDQVVPFLPLERRHVAQCTEAELRLRQADITQQLVDDIVNSLSYFPADIPLFSSSGCRRITHLVDLFL